MKNRSDSTVSGSKLIVADIAGSIVAWGPGAITWMIAISYIRCIWDESAFAPLLLLLPPIAAFSIIAVTFLFRICLPRLKPGVYEVDSFAIKAWYLNFNLTNSLNVSGLMPLIYTTYLTKWLYCRAMGAQIAYGVHFSIYTKFREFQLIKIGRGSSLSAGTHIACHTHVGNKLLLGTVEIGERCFIGMDSIVGPKTKMGDDCWIGFNNRILMDRIESGTKIDNLEWSLGSPAKRKADAEAPKS
ncbi:MAG: hypothetical protein V4692_10815 [Bdellovibrionota bacterium]